jgi:hypothetical protein
MMSPHLLRQFSSRQLSLVEGDGQVVAFGVLGGRYVGPSVEVHAPTLIHRVNELPRTIRTVVFFDEPVPDAATVSTIDDMLAVYEELAVDSLVQYVAATEAVKRVENDLVAEGIDRSALVAIRCPEVIDRLALDRAVRGLTDELWVNPTARVAEVGGSVALYGGPLVPTRRR